jgi:hypothetical protein
MKKLLPIIILSLIINIAAAEEPEIVWEEYFRPQTSGTVESKSIYNFNDTLYIGYTAKNYSRNNAPLNSYALRVDPEGNIIDKLHWDTEEDIKFHEIRKYDTGYFCYFRKYFDLNTPVVIVSDNKAKIKEINKYIYSTSLQYYIRNDSLFTFNNTKSMDDIPYHYVQKLNKKLDEFYITSFDSSTVEIPINYWGPCIGVPAKDGTFLINEYGPTGNDYNDYKYSVLSKYLMDGKALWSTKLDLKDNYITFAYRANELESGSLIYSGKLKHKFNDDLNEMFIAKLSPEGDLEWVNFNEYPANNILWQFKALWGGKYFALYDIYSGDDKTYYYLFLYDHKGREIEKYIWRRGDNGDKNRIFDIVECGNDLIINGQYGEEEIYVARIRPKFLDVNEQQSAPALSLHPNPATDIINISGDMGYNDHVEIYTLEGVCLHRGRGRRIDVSHLARGVYFVRVGAESLRFVKM